MESQVNVKNKMKETIAEAMTNTKMETRAKVKRAMMTTKEREIAQRKMKQKQ